MSRRYDPTIIRFSIVVAARRMRNTKRLRVKWWPGSSSSELSTSPTGTVSKVFLPLSSQLKSFLTLTLGTFAPSPGQFGGLLNGTLTYANLDKYVGAFAFGRQRHGQGIITFADPEARGGRQVFTGNFDRDCPVLGKTVFTNGQVYTGEVNEAFLQHGTGQAVMPSCQDPS